MGDYIEVSAKTVEDAVTKALIQLETTSDKMEYVVVEKGSTGILGIFNSKPAIIKARKVLTVTDMAEEFLKDVFAADEYGGDHDLFHGRRREVPEH